jgi:ABC-type glycerol-3-phosphate transport system permease component
MAKAKMKNQIIQETRGDKILNFFTAVFLVLFGLIVLYPLVYVVSCSFSSTKALESGRVVLWPVDFSLDAYKFVFNYKQVWVGFRNSVIYCIIDLFVQTSVTVLCAYPISRRYFHGKQFYTMFFFLSTRFSAGMIPSFILKCQFGLFDNVLAVVLGGAVGITHMLILRTAIRTNIPEDLFDAARIDGASHFQCVWKLVVPLTKATLGVLMLYSTVGCWNDYFTAMLYLRDSRLYPLQLVLRPIMQAASAAGQLDMAGSTMVDNDSLEGVRYALIIISTVPIVTVYMYVQRMFKGGMMVGSVKG